MRYLPPISPGELLRVLAKVPGLSPALAATLLGFSFKSMGAKTTHTKPEEEKPALDSHREETSASHRDDENARIVDGTAEGTSGMAANDCWVVGWSTSEAGLPDWLIEVPLVPEPIELEDSYPGQITPLLSKSCIRAILAAAVEVEARGSELDVQAVVCDLARARLIRSIPRRKRRRVPVKLQILVDDSGSMAPYRLDQQWVVSRCKALMSEAAVDVHLSEGPPLVAGDSRDGRSTGAYRFPGSGTTILCLTDLGIGPRHPSLINSDPVDWLRFSRASRRRGCEVVALTPYPSKAVPMSLRRSVDVLPWNEQGTSAAIQRIRTANAKRRVE